MSRVARFLSFRSTPRSLGRGDPFGPVEKPGQARRRPVLRSRRISRWWVLLVPVLLLLMAPPVLDFLTGLRTAETTGCRLLSVRSANTLLLNCTDTNGGNRAIQGASLLPQLASSQPAASPLGSVVEVQLLGVQAPPILGARCMTEAFAGIRAMLALRARLWLADDLQFALRAPQGVALAFADGQSVNRALQRGTRDICN